MFRRTLLTLVLSAFVATCDRSEPGSAAPPPVQSQAQGVPDGRLSIRIELTVPGADAEKRVSAEIDRAFESHRDSKRVSEGGEWRIDVRAFVGVKSDSLHEDADPNSVLFNYGIAAVPPTVEYRIDGYGRRIPAASHGRVTCDMADLAYRFSTLIDKIERLARLEPSLMPRDGETDLIDIEDIRYPEWRSRNER